MYHNATDPQIKKRQAIEERIVMRVCRDLIAAGYLLNVDDGGDEEVLPAPTDDLKALKDALMNTDEDYLNAYKGGAARRWSFVRFVYGNDGWDVVCDYGTSLEPVMAPILEFADTLSN